MPPVQNQTRRFLPEKTTILDVDRVNSLKLPTTFRRINQASGKSPSNSPFSQEQALLVQD